MKRSVRNSERRTGYLMVLPAVLIILVIAIYPVIRSFWISLHDVRLNDPAKNEIHTSSGLDMEKYANNYLLLLTSLRREETEAPPAGQATATALRTELEQLQSQLMSDAAFATRYRAVDALLAEYKPVPAGLKVLDVEEATSAQVQEQLTAMEQSILIASQQQAFARPDDVLGLTRGLRTAVIEPNFIGFRYYSEFLSDARMWASLWNTLLFTVLSVALELALGLWVALLINRTFRGRSFVRASILIPWAIPTVISALMWKFMYDGQNGIVAYLLTQVGAIPNMGWLLTTKAGALLSVIVADVWKTTPFMALLLFAGLQTIPDSLYEAAEVDGATKRQMFFRITLPLLKSTVMVALLFRTLDAFRVFDLIYVLTGGGPANSTETISIYAYKTMFAQMNFGAGSALSVIVFVCIALISILYIKLLGADLVGGGGKA